MAQSYKTQNGRPTKTTQLQIQRNIREYYELGVSAAVAASRTGRNIKTVYKYYEEFSEQIRESESSDFLERQKHVRNQIIVTFDGQILSAYQQLDDVEDQIKKFIQEKKVIPNQLFSRRLEISKYITSLIEKKGHFEMQPTMDEGLLNKIKALVRENAKA